MPPPWPDRGSNDSGYPVRKRGTAARRTLPVAFTLALAVAGLLLGASWMTLGSALVRPVPSTSPSGHERLLPGPAGVPSRNAPHLESPLPPHPHASGTSAALTFWGNNSTLSSSNVASGPSCVQTSYNVSGYSYYDNFCFGGAVDPTVIALANGDVGVGYSIATDLNIGSCPDATGNVSDLVAFSSSSDGGHHYQPPALLGNKTCRYYNAIEPSFAVASTGRIYATYVEENFSGPQGAYVDRRGDALAFSVSTDNGGSFSTPVTLNSSGNIARPQIVAFGASLYILFENISYTNTTSLNYGPSPTTLGNAISIDLLYSANDGTTWHGPYLLPGENSSAANTSMGGWIQVNATGTLGVSYFTNHSCALAFSSYCYRYADDLVFATSTSNGSSWSGPFLVAPGVGETGFYSVYSITSYFQMLPESQFVFDPTGTEVYIAYAGSYSKGPGSYWFFDFEYSGIFEATGTVAGLSWALQTIEASNSSSNYDSQFNPAIGYDTGDLYIAFTWENETFCIGSPACSPIDGSYSEWMATSSNGRSWGTPALVDYISTAAANCGIYCAGGFLGFQATMAHLAGQTPIVGFDLGAPGAFQFQTVGSNYYYNYTEPVRLETAFVYSGPTVAVNFTERNLPPGTNWSFSVDAIPLAGTSPWVIVTDVPVNASVLIAPHPVPSGFWEIVTPASSVGAAAQFFQNSTVWFNFSVSYGISVGVEPPDLLNAGVGIAYNGSYYSALFINCVGCSPFNQSSPAFPWYFPVGATVEITSYGGPISTVYWTGSGPGSYNGTGTDANITIGGIINETAWFGGFGVYDVEVNAQGIPPTSVYSFALDNRSYSAHGDASVTVANVTTGAHFVSDIVANASAPGWAYFGFASPASPFIVPVQPEINLTFAYVQQSAAVGTVSFQARGLTPGTIWTFGFNHTVFSSNTPWINVSTRPGTFPVEGFPVTAENSSVGFAPVGLPAMLSVTPGSTYVMNFTQAFKVQVLAGDGGSVTNAGTSWIPSGTVTESHAFAHADHAFGGWTGTGAGSYSGPNGQANFTVDGPIVEAASFFPLPLERFNLTVTATGLAPGTWWTVLLGGVGYSSDQPTLEVRNLYPCGVPTGTYNVSVPYAYAADGLTRFVPTSGLPGTICTTGATILAVNFVPEFFLALQSTPGGFAEATINSFTATTYLWVPAGASVQLTAVAIAPALFLGWDGSGPGNRTGGGAEALITPLGPVNERAIFEPAPPSLPPPRYVVDFHAAATFDPGTPWTLTFAGVAYSSTSADLYVPVVGSGTFPLSMGTALAPDGLTRYAPFNYPPTLTVDANRTVSVTFLTSYWLSVIPTLGGGTSASSQWVASGGPLTINATPAAGYVFVGWQGRGAGSYTGTDPTASVHVSAPIVEVAQFEASATSASSAPPPSSFWSTPGTWLGFAALGAVAGVAGGLWLTRPKPGAKGPERAEAPPPSEEP